MTTRTTARILPVLIQFILGASFNLAGIFTLSVLSLAIPQWEHWMSVVGAAVLGGCISVQFHKLWQKPAGEPEWIVNSLAELGVKIGGRFFFLYKGESIEYRRDEDDDAAKPLRWRPVAKREFGETCKPWFFIKEQTGVERVPEDYTTVKAREFGPYWKELPLP
jgi:hypothetical protein